MSKNSCYMILSFNLHFGVKVVRKICVCVCLKYDVL